MRSRTCALLLCCVSLSTLAAAQRGPRVTQGKADVDQPFSAFHQMDGILTSLDQDSQKLAKQSTALARTTGRSRVRALAKLRREPAQYDALRSSAQLMRLSAHGEALYRRRHQRYGAELFRAMHARASALEHEARLMRAAKTSAGFDRERRRFSQRLLVTVAQFQAISGGYGALSCQPGGWACCQPRRVRLDGKIEVHGCTWTCATRLTACAGGCLGPKTPQAVAEVRTADPKAALRTAQAAPAITKDVVSTRSASGSSGGVLH